MGSREVERRLYRANLTRLLYRYSLYLLSNGVVGVKSTCIHTTLCSSRAERAKQASREELINKS
jgi:hypothetical protein